ncbi:MAG: hypothetical protein ACRETR_02350 [Steroidobacteraceae bacterium]
MSPQVESFCEAHPEMDTGQCILELASVLGELIGSEAYRRGMPEHQAVEFVSELAAIATRQIVHTATTLLFRLRSMDG